MGTPYYLAPEVILGKYDKRCDLWSLGVVAFLLLSGSFPFFGGNTAEDLDNKILTNDYDFEEDEWMGISIHAKRFIEALLVTNPDERMTCEEALSHPWIVQN